MRISGGEDMVVAVMARCLLLKMGLATSGNDDTLPKLKFSNN